jgi:hypothetical protein
MHTDLEVQLQVDVNKIKKVIWEGNGEPPLTIRITKLESSVAMMAKVAWLMLSASALSFFTVIGEILAQHWK